MMIQDRTKRKGFQKKQRSSLGIAAMCLMIFLTFFYSNCTAGFKHFETSNGEIDGLTDLFSGQSSGPSETSSSNNSPLQDQTLLPIETFVPTGFDPGLKKRLAASYRHNSTFFESCPDSPTGLCYGTLNPGNGFYTLPGNSLDTPSDLSRRSCRINSGELFQPTSEQALVPCHLYFAWESDLGSRDTVARLEVNTIPYRNAATLNNYNGLQLNLPIGDSYGGIDFNREDMTPFLETLEKAEFEYRGKVCYGDKSSDKIQFGRIVYYASFWNSSRQNGFTLAFDYGNYYQNPQNSLIPDYVQRESDISGDTTNVGQRNTFYINSYQYGIVPESDGPVMDATTNCSISMNQVPWKKVKIPLKSTVKNLIRIGYIDPSLLSGTKYAGGTIAGVETWGRSQTIIEVKNHSFFKTGPAQVNNFPSNQILPEGKFRLQNDGGKNIYFSNGSGGYCRYLTYGHGAIIDPKEVTRVFAREPLGLDHNHYCSGAESYQEFYRIQELGVYPAGKFRVRTDGGQWMYYSNGTDAFCQYVNVKHAGVKNATDIGIVYDRVPSSMRNDPLCPGHEIFRPR